MNIRPALKSDFKYIAQLHADSIKDGFLSKLGISFLKELYWTINKQHGSCVLVYQTDNKIYGFIAGTSDIGKLYKGVLLVNWYRFIIPLIRLVINPKSLIMIMETVFYGFRKEKSENNAAQLSSELLSISVHNSHRGKGIGKKLVSELEQFLKDHNVSIYKVVTSAEDLKSNGFYRSCNFTLNRKFIHHGNKMNEYVKKI